jgi:xanthine dehydrogenase YagS FAD-binding subunit
VSLPPPVPGERAAYFRAVSRTYAEWPLAEAVARLGTDDGADCVEGRTVAWAAVAVGGVAPVPLRLHSAEAALIGQPATPAAFSTAAAHAVQGANPLPLTGYKAPLLTGVVTEALERTLR